MKIKVKETSGLVLDYLVTKCEGFLCDYEYNGQLAPYSSSWAIAGPIIEREQIDVGCYDPYGVGWRATTQADYTRTPDRYYNTMFGSTPLVAAMRCYVAKKMGDEVEIPDSESLEY